MTKPKKSAPINERTILIIMLVLFASGIVYLFIRDGNRALPDLQLNESQLGEPQTVDPQN